MSTDEYTPTDDEVRSMFCIGISDPTNPSPVSAREAYDGYDRWLAARDAKIAERIAQAIEVGQNVGYGDQGYADGYKHASVRAARIAREARRS